MLHVTGVVNNFKGLIEDFGCDQGGSRVSGKGRDSIRFEKKVIKRYCE